MNIDIEKYAFFFLSLAVKNMFELAFLQCLGIVGLVIEYIE